MQLGQNFVPVATIASGHIAAAKRSLGVFIEDYVNSALHLLFALENNYHLASSLSLKKGNFC